MQQSNLTSIRELLEQMPTEQLDELLNTELEKENPDGNAVRLILDILRRREKDYPVEITPGIRQAWKKYRHNVARIQKESAKPRRIGGWVARVATTAAIFLVILAAIVPQQAEAEDFWEKLARWTDDIFAFVNPYAEEVPEEKYVFQTDNPGLQQVYDAVVELGVTEPVVPMWIPEGYALVEFEVTSVPTKNYVYARFLNNNNEFVLNINIYHTDAAHAYYKDNTQVDSFEKNGMLYNILRNKEMWIVIGSKDNIECSFAIDCQEDTLYKILTSIYTMEED